MGAKNSQKAELSHQVEKMETIIMASVGGAMTAELKSNAATGAPASSWKPYPAYKDSGVEWLGKVPEGWKVQKLKHLAKVNLSNVDKKINDGEDTVKLCNYVDVYYNDYITPDLDFMEATASPDQIDKFALRKGDVIITKDSESWEDIAVPAYVPADLKGVICGYHLAHVRPNYSDINGAYLFWSLCTPRLNHQFRVEAHGITRFGIGKYGIDNSLFIVPPNDEQNFISIYLVDRTRKIDSLIEKKKKMIELLKEERTATINQAVTKGLNPDVPMKDSGIEWLGEVPEKWEVKRLKYISTKIGSGVTPKGGSATYLKEGIPLLRSQNIQFDRLDFDDVAYISEETHNQMSGSKVYPNDVLLNITGASIGRCHFVPFDLKEANVNQHVCIIRPNNKIMTKYLFDYLSSEKGQIQVFSSEKGISREGLTFEQIGNFSIILPQIEEQEFIVQFIESESAKIDSAVSIIEKELLLLQEYRTALISEVVTGKIDVYASDFYP